MALDLDNFAFHSEPSSFRNSDVAVVNLSLSGTIAPGTEAVWTGTASLSGNAQSARLYISQTAIAPGTFANYDADALLPLGPYSGGGNFVIPITGPDIELSGVPLAEIDGDTLSVELRVFNPYASTATVTSNTVSFHYVATEPVGV